MLSEPAVDATSRTLLRWTRLFWVAFVLVDILKDHLVSHINGAPWSLRATWIIVSDAAIFWGVWGILTPAVFLAVRRWPPGRLSAARVAATHFLGATLVSLVHLFLTAALFRLRSNRFTVPMVAEQFWRHISNYLLFDVFVYWALAAALLAAWWLESYRRSLADATGLATRVSELEERTATARLEALRHQLNPHFLFNALNATAGLARLGETGRVTQMLARIRDFLRLTLDDPGHQVPLARELRWLELYVGIERERFRERLTIDTDVPEALHAAIVPALILQPLVENAVRYGLAPDGTGHVSIAANLDGTTLRLTVRDRGRGFGDGPVRERVGLGNTRARLAQLYGSEAHIRLENAPPPRQGALVVIDIPFRDTPLPSAARGA